MVFCGSGENGIDGALQKEWQEGCGLIVKGLEPHAKEFPFIVKALSTP